MGKRVKSYIKRFLVVVLFIIVAINLSFRIGNYTTKNKIFNTVKNNIDSLNE